MRFDKLVFACLTRLVQIEPLWKFLAFQEHWERIFAIIREIHFPNFNSVIREEVVNDIWCVSSGGVISENLSRIEFVRKLSVETSKVYFAIIFEELFLRSHSTSSEL